MRGLIPMAALALLSACGPAAAPDGDQHAQPSQPPPPVQKFFPDDVAEEDFSAPPHDPISCLFQVPWPAAPDSNDVLHVSVTRAVLRVMGEKHVLLPGADSPPNSVGLSDSYADTTFSARLALQAQRPEPDSLGNQITPARLTLRDAWGREVYAGDGALVCYH